MVQKVYGAPGIRRAAARGAVEALEQPRRHVKLQVQCAEGHHVATVYDTEMGPVYVARSGQHAHGSRDFVDAAHHDSEHGVEIVDLLDPKADVTVDDALPASCECGPHTLARSELIRPIESGEHRLLLS
ncbi:hypothetical protein [Saccharomonospora halophila]|uniref:hypothetical protein n=1 Tax=Saccharomonospora halophila TaxID=129922 RepID=UPI00048D7288|nr:hypothetical protein [Saccharomonospora halophila]